MKKPTIQPYKDGIAQIYGVSNSAQAGNMPTNATTLKATLPFEQQMVGINRFCQGLRNNIRIDNKIRTPRNITVTTDDEIVLTDGLRYAIKQIQYPPEVVPPSMDLSLERIGRA